MSVSVCDVFNISMSFCDYIDGNGVLISNDNSSLFKARSIALCDFVQRDIASQDGIIRTDEIDCSGSADFVENNSKLFRINNFIALLSIFYDKSTVGNVDDSLVFVKDCYLYVPLDFIGRVRIIYKAQPKKLDSHYSVFEIDDNIALYLSPLYLAGNFLLEENPEKANLYLGQYTKARDNYLRIRNKTLCVIEDIKDVY